MKLFACSCGGDHRNAFTRAKEGLRGSWKEPVRTFHQFVTMHWGDCRHQREPHVVKGCTAVLGYLSANIFVSLKNGHILKQAAKPKLQVLCKVKISKINI